MCAETDCVRRIASADTPSGALDERTAANVSFAGTVATGAVNSPPKPSADGNVTTRAPLVASAAPFAAAENAGTAGKFAVSIGVRETDPLPPHPASTEATTASVVTQRRIPESRTLTFLIDANSTIVSDRRRMMLMPMMNMRNQRCDPLRRRCACPPHPSQHGAIFALHRNTSYDIARLSDRSFFRFSSGERDCAQNMFAIIRASSSM